MDRRDLEKRTKAFDEAGELLAIFTASGRIAKSNRNKSNA